MDSELVEDTAAIAEDVIDQMTQLVAVSSPSGDHDGAERAVALCTEFLGPEFAHERLPCSTDGCAPDLLASATGSGAAHLLLLGHLDTVVGHADHQPVTREGGRLYGSGTADMKGGVALALALARELAAQPQLFAVLSVLLVCDEEWRIAEFQHARRFAGHDACLCFEAGERTPDGDEGVIVRRKGAGTLRVVAHGVASHSGAAPERGRNALLALAEAAMIVAGENAPDSAERLTVVPTVMHSGEAINVVPASGEVVFDIRADDIDMFQRVLAAVPSELGGVRLEAGLERVWPAMDALKATESVLRRAGELLGRPVIGRARGGASDASHFAPSIPITIDGLGPLGGGAHSPEEHVDAGSIADRVALAFAVARAVLEG